jgi:hypothetical protein
MIGSSAPVTVTVWAISQFAAVKVREEMERVPSVVSELERPMITSAVGWELRRTEKEAVPPDSVVVRPEVVVIVMPAAESASSILRRSDETKTS